MNKINTHYDNIKVAREAPSAVIRAAYRVLVQQHHPDKNPGDERAAKAMQIINQSYDVLSDPRRRREHDEWIAREEARFKQRDAEQEPPPDPSQQQSPPPPPQASEPKRNSFQIAHALLIFGAILFAVLLMYVPNMDKPAPPPGPKPYATAAPGQPSQLPSSTYVRPATAPNGTAWPSNASYVAGYPIENANGYSNVTVDNTQNDSDVFAKLVSLSGETAYPVRQLYVPARQQFTLNQVTAGKYDIRYRDLNTGGLSRSESFEVAENYTGDGVEYSNFTMTLYKVASGNMQTYGLPEAEF